jgi:hypothetical protein
MKVTFRLTSRLTSDFPLISTFQEVIQNPMNRTGHLILQGIIQGLQVFLAAPGVELSPTLEAALHSVLAAFTLIVAGVAQTYNTDGTPQATAFRGKPETAERQGQPPAEDTRPE